MKKLLLAAAFGLSISCATPAAAQSAQERLDERYDRALAAGYKALFLCSAIANAEANGATRTPESVHEWELTGIQAPLDDIVQDLEFEIRRFDSGEVNYVGVEWAGDMPPRYAKSWRGGNGCFLMPIGSDGNLAVSSSPQPAGSDHVWPEAIDSLSSTVSERLRASAFDGTYGENSRTTVVVVIRDEAIILEDYADDFGPDVPQRTWSVAKSIAATMVGYAVQNGDADPGYDSVVWQSPKDPRNAVTIDHLLRMASGRYSDTPGNRTDPLYWGGTTVEERARNWPLVHKPGTVFRYANNDTLMAIEAIKQTFLFDGPPKLFSLLGMKDTVAETDWAGNYVLSSQVWSTARDLARLGQLYLNDGVWEGKQVIPAGWRDYVSDPSGPQPDGPFGYGAGWWLMNKSEGIPPDTFAAFGNRGQYVVVVPSRDVVIVRRGEDMVGTRFDIAAFTRDVLAALAE
jgi:CubicO group peptidase (beta-lactamase class C family)